MYDDFDGIVPQDVLARLCPAARDCNTADDVKRFGCNDIDGLDKASLFREAVGAAFRLLVDGDRRGREQAAYRLDALIRRLFTEKPKQFSDDDSDIAGITWGRRP